MNEVWKDIKGYEGLYQVSNYGRIKSLERINYIYNHLAKRKIKIKTEEKILNGYYDKDGYKRICLFKNKRRYYPFIHRLVAETFISNPKNLPQINHKDEIKDNNNVNNLEWCTCIYNINYGNRVENIAKKLRKKVAQYSINNELIKVFSSITMAAKEVNTNTSSISGCCKGKYKIIKGYIWKYVD